MILITLLSFIVIGIVTVYHFKKENENYHDKRLKRKELAVVKSIGYFLEKEGIYDNPDSVVVLFSDKIGELADINQLDINIYTLGGELLISSHSDYFEKGVFVFNISPEIKNKLENGQKRVITEEKVDSLTILSSYRYMNNPKGKPIAIINMPYFQAKKVSKQEIKAFLMALVEVYFLLFITTAIIAYFLSKYITQSFQIIGDKLKKIKLGEPNEPLKWNSNDEVGMLIKEYNRMLIELEKSALLLAKSERESAWREMAKQVAHEIKNPLTPIKLSVQHLERTLSPDDPEWKNRLSKFSKTVIEQIDTLSEIASEFSNFAKMPKAKEENVDLIAIIKNAVNLFKETPNQTINCDFKIDNCLIIADKDQLFRVFNNLLKNAIQAAKSDENGVINISLQQNEKNILVAISDNGIGIPNNQKEDVFTPNFTTKSAGMGIGLAMVKNMIEQLNGKVWFESEENIGTTFFIEIPLTVCCPTY